MTLIQVIENAILDKKGNDVQIIDFKDQHSMVDAFVITDAQTIRQVWAIVDHIKESVLKAGFAIGNIEGDNNSRWVLIDCLDVVAHVFVSEERQVYQLEKLWGDYLKNQKTTVS